MSHLPVPSDGHACCTSLKKYIEAAERDANATQAAAKKFAERSVAYAAALDEFKVCVGGGNVDGPHAHGREGATQAHVVCVVHAAQTSLETMRKGADAAQSVVSMSAGDVRAGAEILVDTLQKTGVWPTHVACLRISSSSSASRGPALTLRNRWHACWRAPQARL